MAFVFLATQNLSLHHRNESSDRRHQRSRLAARCSSNDFDSSSSAISFHNKNSGSSLLDSSSSTSTDLLSKPVTFNNGVDFTNTTALGQHSVHPSTNSLKLNFSCEFYNNSDFETSDEEEDFTNVATDFSNEIYINNNNIEEANYNKDTEKLDFPSSSDCIDNSPPLIQWPLDNTSKNKRLANIRKQVKQLSTAIKMTIDSDNEAEKASGRRLSSNPVPFSSLVNMGLIHSAQTPMLTSHLPSISDLQNLLKSGKSKESKLMIRRSFWGIDNGIRRDLWTELVHHISKEDFQDSYYWDTVLQIYGTKDISECNIVLPNFIDSKHVVSYALSATGVKSCERVISVIAYNFPAITFAPLVYPLAAIFCHYLEEPEVYHCMSILLSKSNNYISQTKVLHEAMWRAVEILARKHVKGGFATLRKLDITAEQISQGFQSWSRWLFIHLPLIHVVRIVDCFLLEGSKVLLRASLALFDTFIRSVSRDANSAAVLSTKGLNEALSLYCQTIQDSPSKLLKTAFGIRGFSKEQIKKVLTQTELAVKGDSSITVGASGGGFGGGIIRSPSVEQLPTSDSQSNIQALSHTMDIKELLTIWSWIPTRMTMHHPTLIYTTQEHGSSLTNFFQRVDKYEPTILLVRTTQNEVFGAYCSSDWGMRNERDEYGHKQTYFGTGETFLFTLRPKLQRFEWVGITRQRQDASLSSVAHQSELFMHADADMITVGGGRGHGLMLDHDLQFGKTETCETFDNPLLSSTQHFEIKVVEVFSLGKRF